MIISRLLLACLLLLALSGAYPIAAQNDLKEQITVSLSDPAKPGFLTVGLVHGSIRVIGHSGKEIVINAVASARKPDKEEKGDASATGMKRISAGSTIEISAEEKDNRVKVSSDSWKRPIDLTIRVPQRCSLKLGTVNQGDITVENVNGSLEITNVNGAIHLNGISGSAVANTVNGDLLASFKALDRNVPMAFSTLNGNVDITFPTSAKASVKVKSDRGNIYSDFDIDVDKGSAKTIRTEKNGMYRVTVEDWVRGKINGGGPEIMMKNMNGNIYIRKTR